MMHKTYANQLADYISKECKVKVAKYYDSITLSKELSDCSIVSGLMLAKMPHETGYTKLYLLSSMTFDKGEIPEYLTAILKPEIDEIIKHAKE